jgi:hypothetical protein
MARSKEDRDAMNAQLGEFIQIVRRLTRGVADHYPDDPVIVRARKKIMLAADLDPAYVLRLVGEYLYTYRNEITAGSPDFFLNSDYSGDIENADDRDAAAVTSHIIPRVKVMWREATTSEARDEYMLAVQDMLDAYIEYTAIRMGV